MGRPELDGVRVFNPAGKPIGHIPAARALRQRVLRRPDARPPCSWPRASRCHALYVNTQGVAGG